MPEPRRLVKPLESFVQELALCVATNGDRGPALLWPEDYETLPELLRIAQPAYEQQRWRYASDPALPRADGGPGGHRDPETEPHMLASALGALLELRVRPSFRFMHSMSVGGQQASSTVEYIVTVLEGACRCRLTRTDGAPQSTVDLRLRAGGTLFVPRDHAYALLDVHTPTVLMELLLGELN
ncbi:hypothetical protein ACIPPJ_30045 [Streptomyces sp. NPDC086091]|uniref:hypothetical protein n=1 Tax=Streptomyces sp. NPDC086091 TaxID=3365751 RepID=UPI00381510AF